MVSKRPQKVSPAAGLGSTESWLLSKGLPAALAELERVAKTAKDAKPVPMAQRLLLLAKTVLAQHPKRALEVCQYISKVEPEPPIEALVIAGTVQDRLGDRKASAAAMRAVVEAERATPLEKLRAANLLVRLSDQALALEAAKRAFDAMGRPLAHAATLLYIAQVTADWELVDQLTTQLRAGYARGELATINESPRTHVLWCDDERTNLAVLAHWSQRNLREPPKAVPPVQSPQGRRLRVAYLSSDFREHPTARLILGVLRHHDRSQVELFMYCSGWDDGSPLRKEVVAQFDHVHTVSGLSDEAAAALMRSHQIDVLVELNGPTRAHRMGILSYRPAPVQVDYLGWPGSVGGRVVDYVVGDTYTVPEGAEKLYPEKVIRLHPTYQANDHTAQVRPPKPTRQAVGLPEDPSLRILGMFNAINKVHQTVWDTWMQILRAVPNTVLWMLDPGEVARKAIARAALKAGVPLKRIIASPKLPQAVHLARLQCCDLMLDPWPYGGHTSTADALFAGVPVLAMEGNNFAGRVSPGLLRAAGLDELVCRTPAEYVQRAVTLLRSPEQLQALQVRVRQDALASPLFDSKTRARQLEQAFRVAVERAAQGLPPECLDPGADASANNDHLCSISSSRIDSKRHLDTSESVTASAESLRGIPKIIHQMSGAYDELAPEMKQNIEFLKKTNPDWEHRYYDDERARRFIADHFDERYLQAWRSISPVYGAARADLFRYLLLYQCGGLWLDVKSSASRPLSEVLRPDDSFILSHWKNGPNEIFRGWGIHPELSTLPQGEFQNWFIASVPKHPYLEAVIKRVMANIESYDPTRVGVGKRAALRTTGPIAYTQAIFPIKDQWPHRQVNAVDDLGFVYSIFEIEGARAHESRFKGHYAQQKGPLIVSGDTVKAQRVKAIDPERPAPVKTLTVDGIRYCLEHQIGVGAFTRVYKATDEWGHALAVKVYPPGTREALWQNEARQLRRFAGLGVVYLHRVFAHEGHTYLMLDDAGLPVSRCRLGAAAERVKSAVFIARSVLPVLAKLHAAGYCHGDINPQNVLLRLDVAQKLQAVSLVDFGLCRTQNQLDAGSTAMARWTPPPEYYRKQTLKGPALDIWHMGVLLLQVITGKTLDYSEADILADQPLKDARSLQLPIGIALSAALASDPMQRPDAIGFWRANAKALTTSSNSATQRK